MTLPGLLGIMIIYVLISRENRNKAIKCKIRYDRKTSKMVFWTAVILTIIVVTSCVPVLFDLVDGWDAEAAVFVMLCGCAGIPATVVTWLLFADSRLYLKRLHSYGYVVPETRKQTGDKLDLLQREREYTANLEGASRESVALSVICLFVAAGTAVNVGIFFIHNIAVHKIYLFLMVVPIGLWLGGAGYYWWQRRRKRFRDDVELDDGRRVRTHLIPGMVELLICLGFTVFWIVCVQAIAEYMV